MAVLVDSSVWIAAQKKTNSEYTKLKKLILAEELICIIRPIQVEVCQGTKTEELFRRLWEGFLGFECLEVTDTHWGQSAWNYFKCRKKGVTVTTLDCLIATISKEYDIPLWSKDKIFSKIQKIIGFPIH